MTKQVSPDLRSVGMSGSQDGNRREDFIAIRVCREDPESLGDSVALNKSHAS